MGRDRRYVVKQVGEEGDTVLARDILLDDVLPTIVANVLASDVLSEHDEEARQTAVEMVARLNGLDAPPLPEWIDVYGHEYEIEEVVEPIAEQGEGNTKWTIFQGTRLPSKTQYRIALPVPKLRFEIWPNESQHRGRPHCKVSCDGKSATFSIPDGELLVGDLEPNERRAVKAVQLHGEALLKVWYRLRPDDQKLDI